MVFERTLQLSLEIDKAFKEILLLGEQVLKENIEKYKNIDSSTCTYEEKNLYMNEANGIGLLFFKPETEMQHQLAERYYLRMLEVVQEAERQGFRLNKGIVYGNIGISKIIQGETERGIAFLAKGFQEDRRFHGDEAKATAALFTSPLYRQFESMEIHFLNRALISFGSTDANRSKELLESLDFDNRLFLSAHLRRLRITVELLNQGFDDHNTKGGAYAALANLAIFVEDALKRKAGYSGQSLFQLIENILDSGQRAAFQEYVSGQVSNVSEFETRLNQILEEKDFYLRAYSLVVLIRNFGLHNFDISSASFFAKIEDIKNIMLQAIFLLRSSNKIGK